jgi:hypothetical protein
MWGVPPERRTVANAVRSMLYNTAQTTATSISLLLVATSGISSYAVQSDAPSVTTAFGWGYAVSVVAAVLALGCAFSRGGPWLRRDVVPAAPLVTGAAPAVAPTSGTGR